MGFFDDFDQVSRKQLSAIWKGMAPADKEHFINQVSLALSVWGSDDKGKEIAVTLVSNMLEDGSKNLADFGLYPEFLDEKESEGRADKIRRASAILENYRFKHDLPSEPSKDFLS